MENFYYTWNVTIMVVDLFKSRRLGVSCSNSEHQSSHVTVSGSISRLHVAFFTRVSLISKAHCKSHFHWGILVACMSSLTSLCLFVGSCWHSIAFLRRPQVDNVGELTIFVRQKFFEWPEIFILSIDLQSFVPFVKFFLIPTSLSSFPFKYF